MGKLPLMFKPIPVIGSGESTSSRGCNGHGGRRGKDELRKVNLELGVQRF